MENLLRQLVKTDTKPAQEIADEIGLHPNTITRLTKPDIVALMDRRTLASLLKLAAYYGFDVKVNVEFIPRGKNGNGHAA